jgi:hypothetical protein
MKTIAIAGASGFVGSYLTNFFKAKGYEILPIGIETYNNADLLLEIIEKSEILFNLSGANIAQRCSDSYKKILRYSRIDTTKKLIEAISKAKNAPKILISTSAVGIYAANESHDEYKFKYSNDFLGNLGKDWEAEASKALKYGVRTAIFRFGVVLGKNGGALSKMLPAFRFGLGGVISDGKAPFPFVHIDDLASAYEFVINNEKLSGIFNLTAPISTTNSGLTKALGDALHRPTIFPVPAFLLKLIFGEGATVLLDGQTVSPTRLLENGFEFKYPNIEEAIRDIL